MRRKRKEDEEGEERERILKEDGLSKEIDRREEE